MIKRVLSGLTALACALTVSGTAMAANRERSAEYNIDAAALMPLISVLLPSTITAYLNPYGVEAAFNRQTLELDQDASGDDRLVLSGDVISPVYEIENLGETPISVYATVYGEAYGNAVIVDPSIDVSDPMDTEHPYGVNLWVTGGLSAEGVDTKGYDIAKSISITDMEETRTLIESIDGSGSGYFKINGKLNKSEKSWSETDGVHISLILKVIPADY